MTVLPPNLPAGSRDHTDPRSARVSYSAAELSEADAPPHWLELLQRWYDDAAAHPWIAEPNAMLLATADEVGDPDARTVLARGIDETGITFYTNYDSAKGCQLAARPRAAVVFSWLPLERQVRLRGSVLRVAREETESYFGARPRGSQLGAWASPQSAVIQSRRQLQRRLAEAEERFGDGLIPAPVNWGGYRLGIEQAEFWQGREFRLHDRLRYRPTTDGWLVERLAP